MNQDQWQLRVDQDFPAGAVVRNPIGDYSFKTLGFTVVGMQGDLPVFRFGHSTLDKDYVVPVKEYEVIRTSPQKVVRIESPDGRIFICGGALTPDKVGADWMAARSAERNSYQELSS